MGTVKRRFTPVSAINASPGHLPVLGLGLRQSYLGPNAWLRSRPQDTSIDVLQSSECLATLKLRAISRSRARVQILADATVCTVIKLARVLSLMRSRARARATDCTVIKLARVLSSKRSRARACKYLHGIKRKLARVAPLERHTICANNCFATFFT